MPEIFACTMENIPGTRDMKVEFFCRGKEVVYFDIKQMLCHLLGVANKTLIGRNCDTPIQFLYLLYNPTELNLPQSSREEILRIYQNACATAENYDFSSVFGHIIDFLIQEKEYPVNEADVANLKNYFCFALCDQNSYRCFFK